MTADIENLVMEQLRLIRQEQKKMRREIADVRMLCLQNVDDTRRLDRCMGELRDDLELMLKSELIDRYSGATISSPAK